MGSASTACAFPLDEVAVRRSVRGTVPAGFPSCVRRLPVPQMSPCASRRVPGLLNDKRRSARPMTFRPGRGRSVQMGNSTTTCGGPKTLLEPDDNPGRGCDSDRMSGQAAISVDANAIDPIAALKRVGGVRHNTHMRKIGIATAMVAVAVGLAIVAPGV